MRIAMVDNDLLFLEKIEKILEGYLDKVGQEAEIKALMKGNLLEVELKEHKNYDIYILNARSPEVNGLELAKIIRCTDKDAYIIFLAEHERYALFGYQFHAYRYLLKENCEKSILLVLNAIFQEIEEKAGRFYIISNKARYEKVCLDDILYIGKDGKNVIFHCKRFVHTERNTLTEVMRRLPEKEFALIDRGWIVNLRYVMKCKGSYVEMKGGETLPVSRNLHKQMRDNLDRWWKGETGYH